MKEGKDRILVFNFKYEGSQDVHSWQGFFLSVFFDLYLLFNNEQSSAISSIVPVTYLFLVLFSTSLPIMSHNFHAKVKMGMVLY